jgi:molybdopterin molybdotransferase
MKFTDFDETIENLLSSIREIEKPIENVFLTDTIDRVLAVDVIAKENSPLRATSSMDGYAIKFADQEKAVLKLSSRVPAGTNISEAVEEGNCIKTFTGSLMSDGSDTLIPIENVEVVGDEVRIVTSVPLGFAVRPVGENYVEGEVLIKKGATIGFAEIGLMAELGFVQVPVFGRPRVAVIATGSEILDLGETKTSDAQIRSSNHVTLETIMRANGAVVTRAGIVQDDKELIKIKIVDALKDNDIVITTGGVSVGDYDFVKDIIKGLNPQYVVDRASVKPGRHIRVVKLDSKYIVALPGFPYSAAVMAFVYILPLVRAMQGLSPNAQYIDAVMEVDYKKCSPFTEFTACNLYVKEGRFFVNLDGKKKGSSAILTNMLDGSALLRVEQKTELIKKGERVRVLPMGKLF